MTDKEEVHLEVRDHVGRVFSLYSAGPEVWGNFSVIEGEILASEPVIMLRVDKRPPEGQPMSLDLQQALRLAHYEVKPKWVNFFVRVIIDKTGNELLLENSDDEYATLEHLLTGQQLLVRYFLSAGGYKETIFSLGGDPEELARALGASWAQRPPKPAALM